MWGEILGGLAGGLLGGSGGSSGGLPKWLKSQYKDLAANVGNIAPQQYYPGQTYVGALPSELAAFGQRDSYNQGIFGQGGPFASLFGQMGNQLSGNTFGGQMAGALSPYATSGLMDVFNQGPGSLGQYNFDTNLGALGRSGGLDARGALQSALSGTPDYSGAQGAIDAANAPLLRQFNEQLIPGLNQKATFLNNGTGGIKALNQAIPELGQRMSENALGVMEGERQRALGAQQQAASLVSNLGLQRSLANANLGQQQAQMNFQRDLSNAGLGSQFRGDLLGLGGLAGNLAGQDATADQRWAAMFPSLFQAGQQPSQDAANFGAFQRMLGEQALQGDMNRFNFYQQEPYNRYGYQAGIFSQLAPGAQQQPQGSQGLGILGGALTGMGLGGSIAQMFGGQQWQPQQFDVGSLFANARQLPIQGLG
ncbi:hypothetical protein [Nitrospira sp. BLG_2]|uniref:hypothetical protein n=1 Tax=Nitrospira sp. BLG_2 TaxID=3397507 RepID=UPI003B9A2703